MQNDPNHYNVELYGLTHRGNPGDVSYYRKACRRASQILELGCGLGRILLPLAEAGHHVTGLDAHPGMIAHLQHTIDHRPDLDPTRIQLVQADMRNFQLGQQFDAILLPFNGLFCLLNEQDTLSCFQQVHQHLKPGGVFLFDIYMVDEEELALVDQDAWELLTELHEDHRTIQIFERRQWHPSSQRVDASYRYRIHEGTGVTEAEYTIPQRYLTYQQCRQLLYQARLHITQCYSDFHGSPFDQDSYHMIAWARAV